MKFVRAGLLTLLVLTLVSTAAAQAGLTVKVGEVSGAHRQVTEVPIEVTGAANVGSMYLELAYDATVLTPTEVRKGTLTANSLLQPNLDDPGRVKIALIDANGFSGDGSVAVVVFDVPGKDGATSALTLENARASDATSQPPAAIPTVVENGTFRVGAAIQPAGGGTAMILTVTFVVMLAAALLIVWQVTKRRRLAPVGAPPIGATGQLFVTRGQASPSSLSLDRPVITIGRDPSDLTLIDDLASRQHAQIRREAGGMVIYDLGSTNGTFVNGRRIDRPHPLHSGDRIGIGNVELVFQG
jgi:hypothetical protein